MWKKWLIMGLPLPTTNNSLLTFDSDAEAIRVLRVEGKKLEACAKKIWRDYEESYTPKKYVRTGDSLRSIKLGSIKKLDNDEWGIELTFINDLAYHDSVVMRKGESKSGVSSHNQGHAVMLISQGWTTNGKFKDIKRFGKYKGYNYLYLVQQAYEKIADKRITLDIQWLGGKDFTRAKR